MAIVVSEENRQMSVVERARIVRVPTDAQLARALAALLEAPASPPACAVAPQHRAAIRSGGCTSRAARPGARMWPRPAIRHARSTAPSRRRRRAPPRSSPVRTTTEPRPPRSRRSEPRTQRPAHRPVRHPQLAAEARGRRPRHAAVRGPRRVAGQQRLHGPGPGPRRPPARRNRGHPPAQERRGDPLYRARRRGPSHGGRLPGDGRPRRRRAHRDAGLAARDRHGERSPGHDPGLPATHHPGGPRRIDQRHGRRSASPAARSRRGSRPARRSTAPRRSP